MYTHNASQKPTTFTITTDKTTHTDDDVAHAKVHKGVEQWKWNSVTCSVCINVPNVACVYATNRRRRSRQEECAQG